MQNGVMLNLYPDSLGKDLSQTASVLARPELAGAFRSLYILPSVFNTDLDHGFSVISYDLCREVASPEALRAIRELGLDITFDLILNHLSVLSPQFQDVLKRGDDSEYRDFFIDWNRFWQGMGPVGEDGCIHPGPEWFKAQNLRTNRLPLLMVRFPDGREVPFWNTFYQQVVYQRPTVFDLLQLAGGQYHTAERLAKHICSQLDAHDSLRDISWEGFEAWQPAAMEWLQAHRHYLGQLDVDSRSPEVWQWYDRVMAQLAGYGASTIRLDAFTRLHKAPGRSNFMNEPETWHILARLRDMAAAHGLSVLPEMHAPYTAMAHRKIADTGSMPYDYYLPGLVLDALDTADGGFLYQWLDEQVRCGIRPVNMLGCHDGIPVRDLRGLLPDDRIEAMSDRVVERGGMRKLIYGARQETYQLNTTYFSALGCSEQKLLTARAIQMFMPGIPQVWYEDLLAGENDTERLRLHPDLDAREINRRSYTQEQTVARLDRPIVKQQLCLMRLRNSHPAFAEDAAIEADLPEPHRLIITRRHGSDSAQLSVDLSRAEYTLALG